MRNGLILEVKSSTTPDGGRILLVNDISGRHQQEEKLRRSEEAKNAVIESALDCILVMDSQGVIRDFNPAAEATFGWSREEIRGRALIETLMSVSKWQPQAEEVMRFLEFNGGVKSNQRIEITATRRDGEEFPCEFAIAPICADGQMLRLKFQVQHPRPAGHRMLRWTVDTSTLAARNVA